MLLSWRTLSLAALLAGCCAASPAQSASTGNCLHGTAQSAPCVTEVSPPEWWANMLPAMLLVRGEHLNAAQVTLSDPALHVTAVRISANGHWAEVHLSSTPAHAETIKLKLTTPAGTAIAPYAFEKQRAPDDGFAGFSSNDVMYLIMTDRFADGDTQNDGPAGKNAFSSPASAAERAKPRGWHGGDIRGVIDHLDYLQSLGITTVWITPAYANENEPDSYHGYGATDMYKVDPHYGTLADLKALGAALHARHMKLVLDMVPNHVGPANPWVADEPEPDWFHGTRAHHTEAQGDFAPLVDPHAAWRDQKNTLDGWFANVLPDMNQENPDVAQYLIQNTIWWVEQSGADGIRIDTFPYVDRSFWHAYHAELHRIFPRLTSVGEVFNADPRITSAFAGGVTRNDLNGDIDTGLWTPFDFPTYFALRDVLLNGKPMSELAKVWGEDSLYPHPERLVPFLGNHDTARFMSVPGATAEKMRLAFAILLTMRGMPQIYSGDELAMTGGNDPANRHDFPGGFPDDTQSAFITKERTPPQAAMFDWVQHLLQLRAHTPELTHGQEQLLHIDDDTLLYVRGMQLDKGCDFSHNPRVLVAANKTAIPKQISFSVTNTALAGCNTADTKLGKITWPTAGADGMLTLTLPPGASIVRVH
jgi:glycosidase